nr:hypothetical protein Q903MT_gene144 [Picea sitchensis]
MMHLTFLSLFGIPEPNLAWHLNYLTGGGAFGKGITLPAANSNYRSVNRSKGGSFSQCPLSRRYIEHCI